MNFNKNEKGLSIGCIKCGWRLAVLEKDSLKDINKFYRDHKCIAPEIPKAPVFNPREIFVNTDPVIQDPVVEEMTEPENNNPSFNYSTEELLFMILQEIRDQKINTPKVGRPKKSEEGN